MNRKSELKINIGESIQLSQHKWITAITLNGDCLDKVASIEVLDKQGKIRKTSEDKSWNFYVDFETEAIKDYKVDYTIKMQNGYSTGTEIVLDQSHREIPIIVESTENYTTNGSVKNKFLSVIFSSKASESELTEKAALFKWVLRIFLFCICIFLFYNQQTEIGKFQFFQEAYKAVPIIKWALGIGGIMAIIAIVASFINLRIAFLGTVIMLILMTLLLFFASASAQNEAIKIPSIVFAWSVLLLFILVSVGFILSFFFNWPRNFKDLLDSRKNSNTQESVP